MAGTAGWYGLTGDHVIEECGHTSSSSAVNAMDGIAAWAHVVTETHYVVFDLGRNYDISNSRGRSLQSADPIDVDIYVSTDGATWGSPVASGITTFQDSSAWVEAAITTKRGRYVKVVINDTENVSDYLIFGGAYSFFDVYVDDREDWVWVPIANLLNGVLTTTSVSYVDTNFRIPWDSTKYDEIQDVRLVVNATATYSGAPNSGGSMTTELYDFTNAASIGTVNHGSAGYSTNESANLAGSMPTGAALLGVRVKFNSGDNANIRNATLWARVHAPADAGSIQARIIRDVGYVPPSRFLTPTTYTEAQAKRLLYTSANYGDTVAVYFGAWVSAVASGTGYWELWNNTDSSQTSELTWTSAGYATSAALSLTTAKEYTSRVKRSGDIGDDFTFRNAHLIFDISDLTKFEADVLVAVDRNNGVLFNTNAYVDANYSMNWKPEGVGVTKTLYHEAVAKKNTGTDVGKVKLYDVPGASDIANTELSFNSTTITRTRGGSAFAEDTEAQELTLYGQGYTTTSSTLQVDVSRAIGLFTGFTETDPEPEVTTSPLLTLMGVGT
jgi:hypothetical protein